MSCFIMEEKAVAKLATYTAALLNMGYNFFGMEAPKSLYSAFSDCCDKYGFYSEGKIYSAIYQLNIDAVNGRYNDHYQLADYDKFQPATAYKRPEYSDGHYKIDKWMLEMSKRIACFNYQCAEEATEKSELRLAMRDLEIALNTFIVHNMSEWQSAEWGE